MINVKEDEYLEIKADGVEDPVYIISKITKNNKSYYGIEAPREFRFLRKKKSDNDFFKTNSGLKK